MLMNLKNASWPVRTHNSTMHNMHIEIDDLSRPQVHRLLEEHLSNMYELSPPEQVFALDITKLRASDITFWTVWDEET